MSRPSARSSNGRDWPERRGPCPKASRFIGVLGAIALVTVAVVPAAAADPSIQIAVDPTSFAAQPPTIEVIVPSSATSASIPVFIRQTGTKPLKNARLFAIIDGITVGISPESGGDGFTIARRPRMVAGRLSVTVDKAGPYEGPIFALCDGAVQRVATLKVTKQGMPVVEVAEATGGTLAYTVTGTTFEPHLTLVTSDDQPSLVTVTVTPLTSPTSTALELALRQGGKDLTESVTVTPQDPIELQLAATLERPGEYRATLTIRHADATKTTIPVKITATTEAPGFALVEPPDLWREQQFDVPFLAPTTIVQDVTIAGYETAGREHQPTGAITSVRRKEGTDLLIVPGASLPLVSTSAPAHGPLTLEGQLTGIRHAGAYQVDVLYPGTTSVTTKFDFFVRTPAILFLVLVLGSAGVGWLFRTLLDRVVPSLTARKALESLAKVVESLGQQPSPAVRRVAVSIKHAIERARPPLLGAMEQAVLAGLRRKVAILRRWAVADRRAADLDLGSVRPGLDHVYAYLAGDRAGTADADTAEQPLAAAELAIDRAAKLLAEIEPLAGRVTRLLASEPQDAELSAIRTTLTEAAAATRRGQEDDARTRLVAAQGRFLALLLDQLSTRLDVARPLGVPAGEWTARTSNWIANVAEARTASFQEGVRIHDEVAKGLLELSIEGLASLYKPPEPAGDLAAKAQAALQRGELDSARSLYEAALNVVPPARGPALVSLPPIVGDLIGGFVELLADRATGTNVAIVATSWAGYLGLIAAGAVVALQLLWVADLGWGTPEDMLVAIAWGLGLHTVSGFTFGTPKILQGGR